MAEPCLFKNKLWQKKSRESFLLSRLELILPGTHKNHLFFGPLTAAVIGTCVWAGVDNAWEQEKLEARKMLENAAKSHTSGARFVGQRFVDEHKSLLQKFKLADRHERILFLICIHYIEQMTIFRVIDKQNHISERIITKLNQQL